MTTIPSIETAMTIPSAPRGGAVMAPCGGEPPAPQTAWTPLPSVVDARMAVPVVAGARAACTAAPAARPLAEVAAFPAVLEAIAAAPLAPSETVPPVASDAGRAVSPKPPQEFPAASVQSPQEEGAAVPAKPPYPVGVPSSSASDLPAPAEVAVDPDAVPDAGRAVSPKPPQGFPAASAQGPQELPVASVQSPQEEGAAVSSKPPYPVGVPSSASASGLSAPAEVAVDPDVVPDAGRAVSPKPPQGFPAASAQRPQEEGAAVSAKPPDHVGVPSSSVSDLPAPAEAAVDPDAGRAVSTKPPQELPVASVQSPQEEGAAVSSKPPYPVGVPSSASASGLSAPAEVAVDPDVVPDAGRAVSPKPPQGFPAASAQRPQEEGAAVSAKPPYPVGVPSSASALPVPAADETALADAVVAAGVASASPPPVAGVAPADAPAVSAVEVVTAAFAPSSARAVEPAQVFVEAARAVADTLLVTPGLLRGQGEIRIQLHPDVLDGTEIRVAVEGRQLTVAFTPPTAEMAALIEQCRPQLAAHLAERVHAFQIAVDVRRRARSEEKG